MSPRVIVFSNQKGGVGKSTLSRLLGIHVAGTGRKTLLIDTDPQGNLTKSLVDSEEPGLYEALTGSDYDIPEIIPNLFLLSGSIRLASLEKSLIGEMDAYTRMKELLMETLFDDFDYILIDSPPSLGVLTVNALTASRYLIAPMNPAIYSLQGTNDLMATMAKVKKNLNPELSFLGVIVNAFDAHPVITRQIREEIESAFGELVFRTTLSRSVKVEEALAARRGLLAGESKVGDEIAAIGEELIERVEGSSSGGEVHCPLTVVSGEES
ncbi:MAG TPA: AAA family ATPase [Spirochaetota bacterium]|nr:AAA family ATPase [Smithellaceae bacterium]HPL18452.1 AAA family ATPase [Spirochaetota bacterium]